MCIIYSCMYTLEIYILVHIIRTYIREEAIDYGDLEQGIRSQCLKRKLQDVDGFVRKCIQLYETTVVRHGLMLVGPTISGKTGVSDQCKC